MTARPRWGLGFVLACAALLVLVLVLAAPAAVPDDHVVVKILCVLALSLVAHGWRGTLSRDSEFSVGYIVTLASIPLLGLWPAVLVASLSALALARGVPWFVTVFNAAANGLSCLATGATFLALGGSTQVSLLEAHDYPTGLLIPVVTASMVTPLVHCALIAVVTCLFDGITLGRTYVQTLRPILVPYLAYGLFGLLLAVLWDGARIGPLAAVLVLAPLYVARWAWAQHEELQQANGRVVAALVRAVEAKDVYTRGHSERVARAAVMIAGPIGLSPSRTAMLEYAGTLHDVGKIAVPTGVLTKTGRLSEDEFAEIALHPLHGMEMVRDIGALSEAFEGILHHHERMDGRGYPMGLTGEDIPEFARIIAVADAFDAMTSTRSYRDARPVAEAIEELRTWSGQQFDGRFVEALVESLAAHPWEPATSVPAGAVASGSRRPAGSSFDHDDPRAPGVPVTARPRPWRS